MSQDESLGGHHDAEGGRTRLSMRFRAAVREWGGDGDEDAFACEAKKEEDEGREAREREG